MLRSLIVLLLVFSTSARAGQVQELRFGLIGFQSAEATRRSWTPLLDALGEELGLAVRPVVFEDYAGVVWGMGRKELQVAWMGNKAAIEAVDRAGGEIGLRTLVQGGGPGYYAYLLARRDSSLQSVQDLLDMAPTLVFGDGDPNSTSGSVIPGYYIFSLRNLDPGKIFKRRVRNNHEDNFLALAQGRVDAATGNSVDYLRLCERYPELARNVKIIWTSPPVPSDPIVWRKDLAPQLKDKIRAFFVGYAKPASGKSAEQLEREKSVLAGMRWSGFAPSDDSQLETIRWIEQYRERARSGGLGEPSPRPRERRLLEPEVRPENGGAPGARPRP